MALIDKEFIVFKNGVYQGRFFNDIKNKEGTNIIFSSEGRLVDIKKPSKTFGGTRPLKLKDYITVKVDGEYKDIVEKTLGYLGSEKSRFYYMEYVLKEYQCFLWFDKDDVWAGLGSMGNMVNPYTHFIHRGYSKEFEEIVIKECYEYLMGDILDVIEEWIDGYDSNMLEG